MQSAHLETYPQPALLADAERILALNEKAQTLFSGLAPGQPVPDELLCPEGESLWEGCACLEGQMFRLRCQREEAGLVYTFQAEEQLALSESQLDGALYQLRALISEFHRELSPCVTGKQPVLSEQDKDDFARSFDRMVRLMDHLDFLRDAREAELRLEPEDLELGRFCMLVSAECDGLLREMGVRVEYTGLPAGLLVRADQDRLRDALTELISNCARRRSAGGTIYLRLTKQGNRAVLCITDDGAQATPRQRLGLTARGAMPLIPTPDTGAGLGLSVAEKAVRLHGGTLLFSTGEGAPRVYLSLPLTKGKGLMPLHTPQPERNAGRSPYVIALSDVLPGAVVRTDWFE